MKFIYFRLLLFLVFIACIQVSAQKLPSDYLKGNLSQENLHLKVMFKLTQSENDISARLFIPEQLIFNNKVAKTQLLNDSITFLMKDFRASCHGVIIRDSMLIHCIWEQNAFKIPFTLHFVSEEEFSCFRRPQEPQPPFPYVSQEISIENKKQNLILSGTLTLPDTLKKHTLLILISGSGAQNRDEEIVGHKPFMVIADYLSRRGIAVFRFDDRGTAKSTGNFGESTSEDFMTDVLSIVNILKKHPNISSGKIGLLGHSEGALVAMMAAAENKKDISFIISLGGMGVQGKELLLRQSTDIYKVTGMDENVLTAITNIYKEIYDMVLLEKNKESIKVQIRGLLEKYAADVSDEDKKKYGLNENTLQMLTLQLSGTWMKYFLAVRPETYLRKTSCPVLALNGTKDIQVNADMNLNAIEAVLRKRKVKNYEVVRMEGMNHLFQKADKGTIDEYMIIQETIAHEVLEKIYRFVSGI